MGRGTKHRYGVKNLYSFASQETGRPVSYACGTSVITGSRDINTGLTLVVSGGANVANAVIKDAGTGSAGPGLCLCRISKPSGATIPASKGAGYMKVIVMNLGASVEATAAASVDWFAVGEK